MSQKTNKEIAQEYFDGGEVDLEIFLEQARAAGRAEGAEEQREASVSDVIDDWRIIVGVFTRRGESAALDEVCRTIRDSAIREQGEMK